MVEEKSIIKLKYFWWIKKLAFYIRCISAHEKFMIFEYNSNKYLN